MSIFSSLTSIPSYFSTSLSNYFGWGKSYYELRVALDIGSSATKARGYVLDRTNNKLVEDLGEISESVEYQYHLNDTSNIVKPEYVYLGISKILKIISHYYENSTFEIENLKCAGIATAWARNAKNIEDYQKILKANGIDVRVVKQEEEAEIGYKAAVSFYKSYEHDAQKMFSHVLDVGGGSFQIISENDKHEFTTYNGLWGSSSFYKDVRLHSLPEGEKYNVNRYLTKDELIKAREFVKEKISSKIEDFIGDKKSEVEIAGIGAFINKGMKNFSDGENISLSNISQIIDSFSTSTIDEAAEKYPNYGKKFISDAQSNLLLLEGVMEGLGVEKVKLLNAKSVDYVAYDESFWGDHLHGYDFGFVGYEAGSY